jgi:hypothetical protein
MQIIHNEFVISINITGSLCFFRLIMEQEQIVYCLLEGRDVFAVMPTGIACLEVLE